MESFLELLSFYLLSTSVGWGGNVFIQRSGVSIGSLVAPVLSDIFLSRMDTRLDLAGMAERAFRYVYDFIIFLKEGSPRIVTDVVKVFKERSDGLSFTFELPKSGSIQFLDLKIDCNDGGMCWEHTQGRLRRFLATVRSTQNWLRQALQPLA